ncbi:MAG: hypothetical protein QOG07_3016 [Pseudonocardiales bacterium]|jgi:hypothetical protein|nr:hypothetical protein [Pseudonocardiales bacterium]
MSPNEFQLRSALHDGEGEPVNPDTVIARARGLQQARHDQRVRYGSVAAVVAFVGGLGVVGSVALGGGDNSTKASNKGATNYDSSAGQAGGGRAASNRSNQPAAPGPTADGAAVPCPDSPPKLMLPGGGGSGQFGAQGPLFSDPVEAVKVCAYTSSATTVVPSTVLVGGYATDLIKSMEAAGKTLPASSRCPGGPAPTDRGSLVVIGVGNDGKQLNPVVVTLGCPTRVTNGTALRYNWTPPANINKLINQRVSPGDGAISLPPPGKVTGSPINS